MKAVIGQILRQCHDGSAILRKTPEIGLRGELAWNKFGIRDPSLLMDQHGNTILDEAGRVRLFFNARNSAIDAGGMTCVGVAQGNHDSGWSIGPMPIFVDGTYAAQGSVLQLTSDHFRMYYSPDTLRGFALASSTDGERWSRFGEKLILGPSMFGIRRMGLPFVRWAMDQWVMLFEGIDNGRFHIYLAVSEDGINWVPGNHRKPIYSPPPGSWDAFGQANPSLYVDLDPMGHPFFYILYNGCSVLHGWDVGILTSDTLEGPWHGVTEPLLKRGAMGEWDAGRVEGARVVNVSGADLSVVYFGLPAEDSYSDGRIAFASIEICEQASLRHGQASVENAEAERAFNDKLALRYFDIWDNYPIQRFTTEMESRLMAEVISPSSSVLLAGSGGGRELPVLLRNHCQVTAVDISPKMLAVGKARYPEADVNWIEADLHHLPAHLVDFDAAVCLGAVFNYLRDPPRFLSKAHRALKPGGALIMAVINARHPSEAQARAAMPDGRFRQLYDLATIKELLSSAGFEQISARGIRFFVDHLPGDWNRGFSQDGSQSNLLSEFLALEARLTNCLPTEQGKFILVHCIAKSLSSSEGTDA